MFRVAGWLIVVMRWQVTEVSCISITHYTPTNKGNARKDNCCKRNLARQSLCVYRYLVNIYTRNKSLTNAAESALWWELEVTSAPVFLFSRGWTFIQFQLDTGINSSAHSAANLTLSCSQTVLMWIPAHVIADTSNSPTRGGLHRKTDICLVNCSLAAQHG